MTTPSSPLSEKRATGKCSMSSTPFPYSARAAHLYGAIAASVSKSGRSPRPRRIDLMLASVAADIGAVLVTRNAADFAGVGDIARVIAV